LLFVIAIYARGDKSEQRTFSKMFKEDIYQAFSILLNEKYDFYLIDDYTDSQINLNFRVLNGTIYKISDFNGTNHLILALESKTDKAPYEEIFNVHGPIPLSEIQTILPCPPSK
jgi:hypothetical protein